jgi:hypothetical protein
VAQAQIAASSGGLLSRGHTAPGAPSAPFQCVNWAGRKIRLTQSLSKRSDVELREARPPPLQGAARSTARCVLRVRRDDGAFRGVRQRLHAKGLSETGTSDELVERLVEHRREADAAFLAAKARAAD